MSVNIYAIKKKLDTKKKPRGQRCPLGLSDLSYTAIGAEITGPLT